MKAQNKKTEVVVEVIAEVDGRVQIRFEDGSEKDMAKSTFKKSWKVIEDVEPETAEVIVETEEKMEFPILDRYNKIVEYLGDEFRGTFLRSFDDFVSVENLVDLARCMRSMFQDKEGHLYKDLKYRPWMAAVGRLNRFIDRYAA